MSTTIQVSKKTAERLKELKKETYDQVINWLLEQTICKDELKPSGRDAIKDAGEMSK